jgi:hypothetical protein
MYLSRAAAWPTRFYKPAIYVVRLYGEINATCWQHELRLSTSRACCLICQIPDTRLPEASIFFLQSRQYPPAGVAFNEMQLVGVVPVQKDPRRTISPNDVKGNSRDNTEQSTYLVNSNCCVTSPTYSKAEYHSHGVKGVTQQNNIMHPMCAWHFPTDRHRPRVAHPGTFIPHPMLIDKVYCALGQCGCEDTPDGGTHQRRLSQQAVGCIVQQR